jgi:hypothetical protein
MRRHQHIVVVIAAASLACACGGGSSRSNSSGASNRNPSPGASPQAGTTAPSSDARAAQNPGAASQQNGNLSNRHVTMVGCLQGPAAADAATGTSGSGDRGRAGGADTGRDNAAAGTYRLVNASPTSNESAGSGANGAGGSGGPLVNARSTFDLDGVPPTARDDVNKQVRVSGLVDPTDTIGRDRTDASSPSRTDASSSSSPTTGTSNRRFSVEKIEVIAQRCEQR